MNICPPKSKSFNVAFNVFRGLYHIPVSSLLPLPVPNLHLPKYILQLCGAAFQSCLNCQSLNLCFSVSSVQTASASCLASSCSSSFLRDDSYSSFRARVFICMEFSMTITPDQSCNFFFLHNLRFISANVLLSPLHYSYACSIFHLSP